MAAPALAMAMYVYQAFMFELLQAIENRDRAIRKRRQHRRQIMHRGAGIDRLHQLHTQFMQVDMGLLYGIELVEALSKILQIYVRLE